MNLGRESELVEFKESTARLSEALNDIVAMLNKHGHGTLYLGVKDNGDVIGLQIGKDTVRNVSKQIQDTIEPKIFPTVEVVPVNDKSYIKVSFSGDDAPYSAKGKFTIRVSDQNKTLSAQDILAVISEKNYVSKWETKMTNYNIDDIDDETLDKFYKAAKDYNRLELSKYNKEKLLVLLGVLKGKRLNNAGYFLFGKNVNIPLKLALYATNNKSQILDLKQETGNIYQLVEKAISYIHSNIRWKVLIGSHKREEIPEIPVEAIREIVVNSFAHSKYDVETEHEISIFSDRIIIYNPGSFPPGLTPLNFVNDYAPSIKRNPIILDALFRSKDVEKAGSGFSRAFSLCKEKQIEVNYKTLRYGFSFEFKRKADSITEKKEDEQSEVHVDILTPDELWVYEYIKSDVTVTNKQLAKHLKKSERTVQRITNSLVTKGLIKRSGVNQYSIWLVL